MGTLSDQSATTTDVKYIQDLRLSPRHWYIVLVASMEQLIGACLSTIVGIIIPLLNLFLHPELSAATQGIMGAIGLIGIALGSSIVGPLGDRMGYAGWFRICALLIALGSVISSLLPDPLLICCGLFVSGFGLGGGYPLDSAYISELMPDKWRNFMVGVAKTVSAIGFILPAVIAMIVLHYHPHPEIWRYITLIVGILGFITFIMRIKWPNSPVWLAAKGQTDKADKACLFFFGKGVTEKPIAPGSHKSEGFRSLFQGTNLLKVIYSGVPWACEGLGVYGIGVFMPVLIMAMGLDTQDPEGIPQVIYSVGLTAAIDFFILPGFIIGLLVVNRMSHNTMLWSGFVGSAIGMSVMLAAYLLHWPSWVMIAAFMFFEALLNAGPHLITYIIPTTIYPVTLRGAGSGVASFLGKVGAIVGVFFMPVLLRAGGMTLVLEVTIAVMLLGALITVIFGRILSRRGVTV